MNRFLKEILKHDGAPVDQGGGFPSKEFNITNPKVTRNNSCETVFEGIIQIPLGRTGTATGVLIQGHFGGGQPGINGATLILGTVNGPQGAVPYVVDLGNSDLNGQGSIYNLTVTLDTFEIKSMNFERTAFHSSFYDNAPC